MLKSNIRTIHGTRQQTFRKNEIPRRFGFQRRTGLRGLERRGRASRIARHARAERLVRTKLIVGVDDAVWQRQLFTMSRMILSKLTENLGDGLLVDELEFRVAPQQRGPQRAERSAPSIADDEADGIEDADLRRLYITAREKGNWLEADGKRSTLRGRSGEPELFG